jgi:glyoxylase-like metal-dependent hydrolase (beta-lactamase superfamily II)
MPNLPAFDDLGNGVYCVDTGFGRARMAACYLVTAGNAAAFIDTGTAYTVPSLLALLKHLGLTPEQVRYVIPTHVHLDHAGGSGQLMAACPNATLVVHPRGAPHVIDPSKLAAGATAVYGEAVFRRDFGSLEPVAENRCVRAADGQAFSLNGRELVFIDTPGHANHHGCIWDAQTRGFFTGDTFGIAYPEFHTDRGPWLFAPTTPVAFDPPAWHRSIDRLMAFAPDRMYLTHFGEIPATERLAARLHASVDSLAALAERNAVPDDRRPDVLEAGVDELLLGEAHTHGVTLPDSRIRELLAVDIDLNAQGLEIWLVRQQKRRSP